MNKYIALILLCMCSCNNYSKIPIALPGNTTGYMINCTDNPWDIIDKKARDSELCSTKAKTICKNGYTISQYIYSFSNDSQADALGILGEHLSGQYGEIIICK